MSQNAQKIPLARSLPTFAQQKALDEIAKRGRALPGHVIAVTGSIVTINFDVSGVTLPQVAMPLFGPEYIRYPIQMGDLGVAFPADTYLGGISGLGGGVADLSLRGNLTTLVWFPIANSGWPGFSSSVLTAYGKTGVKIQSDVGNSSEGITVTPGNITLNAGGHTISISSAGVSIDGKVFLTHAHTLVQTGTSDSGPVA